MPWSTPTLKTVRQLTRDAITAALYGAVFVGNNVLRVMADAMSGLAHHTLRYIDWLALQLLPDTAETEWLDRHGQIWLVNSDGTIGRKLATLAFGSISVTGTPGVIVPLASTLISRPATGNPTNYETIEQVIIGQTATTIQVRALDPGAAGNMVANEIISFQPAINGVTPDNTVIAIAGGADDETDDQLRMRVLQRIQEPPMGGDASDYVAWVEAVPGVTRAWSFPLEQGMGTVVIRFMCDDLRADNNGFPLQEDVDAVAAYLDTVRPVAVKDVFVVAPIPFPINLNINQLVPDTSATREAIELSLRDMLFTKAVPGGTIYASWVEAAIADAVGVDHFELLFTTTLMPSPGHLAILGSVIYAG
jgi:uncharacterized phage protein gp47/JayE